MVQTQILVFNEMMLRSALHQTNTLSRIFVQCQFTETTVRRHTCHPTQTHYPDSEPTSRYSFSSMRRAQQISNKYNFIVFGLTRSELELTITITVTLLTLPEYMSSPPVFSAVRVTRSLVLYVCFVDRCLSFCTFSFGHCVVCSSSIYGF